MFKKFCLKEICGQKNDNDKYNVYSKYMMMWNFV